MENVAVARAGRSVKKHLPLSRRCFLYLAFIIQLRAARCSGHKSALLYGKDRCFADPSYACRGKPRTLRFCYAHPRNRDASAVLRIPIMYAARRISIFLVDATL